MKYNMVDGFRKAIASTCTPATAATYAGAVGWLLNEQVLIDCRDMDIEAVLVKLRAMKYKGEFSKYRSAFLKFCEYLDIDLDVETLTELKTMANGKKKKRRQLKPVRLKDINNHIKVIRDTKLKLSFQAMLASGLRVSELSQIKKEDCEMKDDCIVLHFVGKGGKNESIEIHETTLNKRLMKLIDSTPNGVKVFYQTHYLQTEAKKRGFQCHDLRRAYAKLAYKKTKDISKVRQGLRHVRTKTTKLYLNSKVQI